MKGRDKVSEENRPRTPYGRATAISASLCVVFSLCFSSSLWSSPTIDEVAGEQLQVLVMNEKWRIFSITLAPGAALLSHQSGPRAIVLLTALDIVRLDDSQQKSRLPAFQSFWLTNLHSGGIQNVSANPLVYLVMEARNPEINIETIDGECLIGINALSNGEFKVCLLQEMPKEPKTRLDQSLWFFNYCDSCKTPGVNHGVLEQAGRDLGEMRFPLVLIEFHD